MNKTSLSGQQGRSCRQLPSHPCPGRPGCLRCSRGRTWSFCFTTFFCNEKAFQPLAIEHSGSHLSDGRGSHCSPVGVTVSLQTHFSNLPYIFMTFKDCPRVENEKMQTLQKVRMSHQHPVEPRTVVSESLNSFGCSRERIA